MENGEKNIGQTLADAVALLPEDKKQYFVGYAEGVAAMANQIKPSKQS